MCSDVYKALLNILLINHFVTLNGRYWSRFRAELSGIRTLKFNITYTKSSVRLRSQSATSPFLFTSYRVHWEKGAHLLLKNSSWSTGQIIVGFDRWIVPLIGILLVNILNCEEKWRQLKRHLVQVSRKCPSALCTCSATVVGQMWASKRVGGWWLRPDSLKLNSECELPRKLTFSCFPLSFLQTYV
jgi:hypothetical protein